MVEEQTGIIARNSLIVSGICPASEGVSLEIGMPINLTVNGGPVTVDAPGDTPLLWVIREELQLHGTKYGCGIGQCGACTVHLNGEPARSCMTPLAAAANAHITTIEGLAPAHARLLQAAWLETDVPQCGYCQVGQIMSAAALLEKHSAPTDDDITLAMNGNLCRCGTYVRIRQAIHKAAAMHTGAAPEQRG